MESTQVGTSPHNPRKYQLEILERASKENTLAFLPTGSGKTFISVLLIKHRLQQIRQNIANGCDKQVIAFLAPTKILVGQQRRYIAGNSDAIVRSYTGDSETCDGHHMDNWNAADWKREFKDVDVMVMTSEILRQILDHNFIPITSFNTVILDECHHAFGNDPMALVCNIIRQSSYKPLILGMTASPIPGKTNTISDKIKQLEKTTQCRLVTPVEAIEDLRYHVPLPKFYVLRYEEIDGDIVIEYINRKYEQWGNTLTENMVSNADGDAMEIDMDYHNNYFGYEDISSLISKELLQVASVVSKYLSMCQAPRFSNSPQMRTISLVNEPCIIMYHSLLRMRHCMLVCDILKLLRTLGLEASELYELEGLSHLLPKVLYSNDSDANNQSNDLEDKSFVNTEYDDNLWNILMKGLTKNNLLTEMHQLMGKLCRVAQDSGVLCAIHAFAVSLRRDRKSRKTTSEYDAGMFSWLELDEKARKAGMNNRSHSHAEKQTSTIDLNIVQKEKQEIIDGPFSNAVSVLVNSELVINACLIDMFAGLCSCLGRDRCKRAEKLLMRRYHDAINKQSAEKDKTNTGQNNVDILFKDDLMNDDSNITPNISHDGRGDNNSDEIFRLVHNILLKLSCDSNSAMHNDDLNINIGSYGLINDWALSQLSLRATLAPWEYAKVVNRNHLDLRIAIIIACHAITDSLTADDLMNLTLGNETSLPLNYSKDFDLVRTNHLKNYQHLDLAANVVSESKNCDSHLNQNTDATKVCFPLITCKTSAVFKDLLFRQNNGKWDPYSTSDPNMSISNIYSGTISLDMPEKWCAIVFCTMRLTAVSMCLLFQTLLGVIQKSKMSSNDELVDTTGQLYHDMPYSKVYKYQEIRPQYLIGASSEILQSRVLVEFKSSACNVLFATDVAEEGLDVRVCQLVLNYDAPKRVKSHIQRRGRARAGNSQVITLIPNGRNGEPMINEILQFCHQENALNDCGREGMLNIYNNGQLLEDGDTMDSNTPNESYFVESTGAKADIKSAVQIITQYCQKLPHDNYHSPNALYWIGASMTEANCYKCSILLPQLTPHTVRCLTGPSSRNKTVAKGLAALLAVRKLHEIEELDDWLLPVMSESSRRVVKVKSVVDGVAVTQIDDMTLSLNKKRSHSVMGIVLDGRDDVINDDTEINQFENTVIDVKIVPDALITDTLTHQEIDCNRSFDSNDINTTLFLYSVHAKCKLDSSSHVIENCVSCKQYLSAINSFGIAVRSKISNEIVKEAFPLSLRDTIVDAWIEFIEERHVSPTELREMQRFHRAVLCWEDEVSDNPQINVPLSEYEWTSNSTGWYVIFPTNHLQVNSWGDFLKESADVAHSLVSNLRQYRNVVQTFSESSTLGNSLVSNHLHGDDLVGKVFYRGKDMYVGCDGECTTLNNLLPQESNENDLTTNKQTYGEYYLSKNRLTESELMYVMSKPNHKLISGLCVSGRLTLIELLNPVNVGSSELYHKHATVNLLIPEQCVEIGSALYYFIGLVAPSIMWRVNSLMLSLEVREKICSNALFRKQYDDSVIFSAYTGVDLYTSNNVTHDIYTIQEGGKISEFPGPFTMLEALTPRMANEMINSERIEFLGDSVLKYVTTWALYCLYPQKHEGFLTSMRMKYITNSFLSIRCRQTDLVQYMRALTMSTGKQYLRFPPPGRQHMNMPQVIGLWNTNISKVISNSNALVPMDIDVDSNENGNEVQSCITNMLHLLETSNIIDKSDVTTETGKSKTTKSKKVKKEREKRGLYYAHASVKVKTLADLIESVIGAFYIQGGLSAAIGVIRAIGAWPLDNVQLHEQIPTKTVCRYQPPDIPLDYPPELSRIACGLSMNISTKDYDCGHELSSVTINELQAKLGYRFRNILYLEEALTHCSWQGKPSNQRLEFLGDAVLDFAVVDFIYKNRPSYLDQGKLTNIKCTSTSNKRLATLAVRLEMYKYMLVMSSSLIGQFGDIETWKETCANRAPTDTFLDLYEYDMSISDDIENIAESSGGTKALADVVEAIFGAVFIDSNCSFLTMVELVQRLHIVSTFTEN